jgi:hypothetical protein
MEDAIKILLLSYLLATSVLDGWGGVVTSLHDVRCLATHQEPGGILSSQVSSWESEAPLEKTQQVRETPRCYSDLLSSFFI